MNKKKVVIVVPISNRSELTPSEKMSLRHLHQHLGQHDIFIVAPEGLDIEFPGLKIKRFSPKYFGSVQNYQRMVMSSGFYKTFGEYEYMLTYHLDALVFSDRLLDWCEKGYDFIGAPWVKHDDSPNKDSIYEGKVGNSGFALKKIDTFIRLFDSDCYAYSIFDRWAHTYGNKSFFRKLIGIPSFFLGLFKRFNGIEWEVANWQRSEEVFLITRATHYLPSYRVPDVEEALKFAFEIVPKYCYELNSHKLPFGCHAWERYDEEFWEPYLLK